MVNPAGAVEASGAVSVQAAERRPFGWSQCQRHLRNLHLSSVTRRRRFLLLDAVFPATKANHRLALLAKAFRIGVVRVFFAWRAIPPVHDPCRKKRTSMFRHMAFAQAAPQAILGPNRKQSMRAREALHLPRLRGNRGKLEP